MQLRCQQDQLHRGLSAVSRAVPARTVLPITGHVLLEAEGGHVKLSATDAETIAITYTIDAAVAQPGSITLPSRLLSDFVATLPREEITITLAERSRQASLSCARNDASIGGMDPDEFPPIPPVQGTGAVQVEPERLRTALEHVVFAAATDDSRPVLTGVHFAVGPESIRLATADGFRLAVYTLELAQSGLERDVIVPARALAELARLLPEAAQPVTMTVNTAQTQVLFDLGHATLIANLIQGTFPNYQQLIPASSTMRSEVAVGEFKQAVRLASIFARDGSGIVRLIASPGTGGQPGKLMVTARADEVGNNEAVIDALVAGDEARIAFNSRYLIEVLNVLTTDRVAIETTSPSSPGVVRPVGDDRYVHVVMPMFVEW
ncbi:MAG: DNA polymerase III subunit beta [Chloroflexi bacterium]|nr:DNA polymerase III subunit beta [Chloroflexota bacterium]